MSELKVNKITDTDGNEVLKSTSGTWTTSLGILNVNGGSVSNSTLSNSTLSNSTLSNNTIATSTLASTNTFPEGHIIQVVEFHSEARTSIYDEHEKIYDVQIVTKNDNSKIYVALNTCRGTSKRDSHCAMAMGYKTGATSTSSSDYTSLHSTTAYEIEPIPNLGAFWGQETQDPNSHNSELGRYGMVPVLFNKLHEPNVPAGTTLSYSLWGAADSSRFLAIGGPSNSGTSLSAGGLGTTGYDSSITLMEISSV